MQEQFQPDFEVTNRYLSNHPESHFVTGLIAARPDKVKRYTLYGNRFSIHHVKGKSEKSDSDCKLLELMSSIKYHELTAVLCPGFSLQ